MSPITLSLAPGQSCVFSTTFTVAGVLTDAALVLTLQLVVNGVATGAPIVDASPVRDSLGTYHSSQNIPTTATPGIWVRRWDAVGPGGVTARDEIRFWVTAPEF